MDLRLDDIVDSIIASDAETPQLLLRTWLDDFYRKSTELGLSSAQLIKMINFACHSTTLSMTTRLYILENCLWPNDFLSRDVIKVVISQLGTATAISDFKIQTPKKLQVALCRWLVHVFFLVTPNDELPDSHLDSSIWLHLWQYDFLQHWLTYIVVWSTTSPKDVKRWKVTLVEKVGSKPIYQDSRACATLILHKLESIIGSSNVISRAIDRLNCNGRRLNTLQSLEYDENHIARLRTLLLSRTPSKFTDKILDELISSSLNQLRSSGEDNMGTNYLRNPGLKDALLQNAHSLHKLAWQWDRVIVPKNVELLLHNTKRSPYHFYLLALPSEHEFWVIAYQWICMSLRRAFSMEDMGGSIAIVKNVIAICLIQDSLIPLIAKDFFSVRYLKANRNIFVHIFSVILPLQMTFEGNLTSFERSFQEILAYSFLNDRSYRTIFPPVVKAVVLLMQNWLKSDTASLTHLALKLLQVIQELLLSNFDNVDENRLKNIELINLLNIVSDTRPSSVVEKDLKYLIVPRGHLHRLLIADDPLLLNACCNYLINTKQYLLGKEPANKYVQRQNDYILDLTNYLWRNKLLDSKRFLNIPSVFLRVVIDNTYLPIVDIKAKTLSSISGIPSMSYASLAKLRELERASHAQLHYLELINDEGFKRFKRNQSHSESWLYNDPSSLHDLKLEILKAFRSTGPYGEVAGFLFTYLKSLSEYNLAKGDF